jgi:hypothetical protein
MSAPTTPIVAETRRDSTYVAIAQWVDGERKVLAGFHAKNKGDRAKGAGINEAGFVRWGDWIPNGYGWRTATVRHAE